MRSPATRHGIKKRHGLKRQTLVNWEDLSWRSPPVQWINGHFSIPFSDGKNCWKQPRLFWVSGCNPRIHHRSTARELCRNSWPATEMRPDQTGVIDGWRIIPKWFVNGKLLAIFVGWPSWEIHQKPWRLMGKSIEHGGSVASLWCQMADVKLHKAYPRSWMPWNCSLVSFSQECKNHSPWNYQTKRPSWAPPNLRVCHHLFHFIFHGGRIPYSFLRYLHKFSVDHHALHIFSVPEKFGHGIKALKALG